MMESIIFDILSQNKKVSTLSLENDYKLTLEEVKNIERQLFAHDNIVTNYILICENCGAVVNSGVFYKSLKAKEHCYVCNSDTESSNKILIFTKKKLSKSE